MKLDMKVMFTATNKSDVTDVAEVTMNKIWGIYSDTIRL